MQDLLVDFITSLDGYGAAEGWPGFWGLQGPEYLAWLGEQPERNHTILMGANTYRLMSDPSVRLSWVVPEPPVATARLHKCSIPLDGVEDREHGDWSANDGVTREDPRARQRERNEQRSHRADGATVTRCARPVGVSKRQQD